MKHPKVILDISNVTKLPIVYIDSTTLGILGNEWAIIQHSPSKLGGFNPAWVYNGIDYVSVENFLRKGCVPLKVKQYILFNMSLFGDMPQSRVGLLSPLFHLGRLYGAHSKLKSEGKLL